MKPKTARRKLQRMHFGIGQVNDEIKRQTNGAATVPQGAAAIPARNDNPVKVGT